MNNFIINCVKKLGEFKQAIWDIPEENKVKIRQSLSERFAFFYQQLNVVNTKDLIGELVKPVLLEKTQKDFNIDQIKSDEVNGLSD